MLAYGSQIKTKQQNQIKMLLN